MSAIDAEKQSEQVRRVFLRARRDKRRVVLEGFHAVKHALRFGAAIEVVLTDDPGKVLSLARDLSPDLVDELARRITVVQRRDLVKLTPNVPYTGVIAITERPNLSGEEILARDDTAPVILLENPRHFGNIGAVVRVSAAANAAGVVTTGVHDPWDSAALRGAAGLHFAIPVASLGGSLPSIDRQLVALTPQGDPIHPRLIDDRAVLAFGTERQGLSDALLSRADRLVRLPMREGVSSLNLATSVAATLYALIVSRDL